MKKHVLLGRTGLIAVLMALAGGCSAEVANLEDLPADEDGSSSDAASTTGDPFVEVQRARESSLSNDEKQEVLAMFAASGVTEQRLAFEGRLIVLDGDGLLFVDDVLGAPDPEALIPKGRVHSTTNTSNVNTALCTVPGQAYPPSTCPQRPVDQADGLGGTGGSLSWRRPDTHTKMYWVVATAGVPSVFLGTNGLLFRAINKIQDALGGGATGDCLQNTNAMFVLRTQAEYDALSAGLKEENYEIFVRTFTSEDPNPLCGERACATFPRTATTSPGGPRLAFGPGIAFRTTSTCPTCFDIDEDGLANDPGDEAVGVVIHELLHAMGIAHNNASDTNSVVVPGTPATVCSKEATTPPCSTIPAAARGTVMHDNQFDTSPFWNNWQTAIPLVDQNMLRKLYGPGDSTCAYSNNFRTITACGPTGISSGSEVCCAASCGTCGGSGCGSRPGGSQACCTDPIRTNNIPCGPNLPPCLIQPN